MPYLAARVPSDWQVSHVDEEAEDIDWTAQPDVVGITFHTPSADHAYDLAARFRSRGACVALGGPHVTLLPEEAGRHADVIFVGEAEGLWEEFLDSFATGTYRPVYQQAEPPSLEGIPMARKTLYHRNDFTSGVLFATRGCPNRCDFCSVVVMYRHGLRKRPIAEVAAEYGSFQGKIIIFWDDNIAADKEYAKELFRAIAPYRKWWSSQATVQAARDDEFLDAAARSGCKQLFLGLESVSQLSMNEVRKGFNRVEDYARIVNRVHAHGIAVQAGIVFGFDNDTPAIFKDTLDFVEEMGVQNATFNILTPYPGTPLFRRLDGQGAYIDPGLAEVQRTHGCRFSAESNECRRTPGGLSICESAFLLPRQCGQTVVAISRSNMVDSPVESGLCDIMGQRAVGALAPSGAAPVVFPFGESRRPH